MALYLDSPIQDANGVARAGVTITYKTKDTATIVATFTSDDTGQYDCSTLLDGVYDVTYSGGGLSSPVTVVKPIIKNTVGTATVAGGDFIPCTATSIVVTGLGGAVTLTSTPTIQAGQVNQVLTIVGASDTNIVTLQSQNTLAGSTLKLKNGQNFTLGAGDVLVVRWDGSQWIEINRSDNYNT